MIDSALQRKRLGVYGQGLNVRDWIYVKDHARGLIKVLERGRPGEVYDFSGRMEVSNLDMVKRICRLLDHFAPRSQGLHEDAIEFVTDRLGHDFRYAIDDTKVRQELDFTAPSEFDDNLAATVKWYVENQNWVKHMKEKVR